MEVKENRPDACAASGTANSIYKDFSTDAPDIQEELTGPVLPDECAADIVSFCSEQTIAYDDLLEYATLFYLQDKDPEDPPFRDTLKFELLTLTNRCIDAYNFGKRDPNAAPGAKLKDAYPDKKEGAERYKRLSGLHTLQIAIILYKLHHAVGILWNNSHDDGNFDIGIYQYSGDNEGCYDVGEQNLKSLIRGYCKTGTIKDVNETIEALRAICPRVERCRNRDLVAVNNGIYDYGNKILMAFDPAFVFTSKKHVDFVDRARNPVIHNNEDGTDWDVVSWMNELSDDPDVVSLLWQIIGATVRPYVIWNKSAWLYETCHEMVFKGLVLRCETQTPAPSPVLVSARTEDSPRGAATGDALFDRCFCVTAEPEQDALSLLAQQFMELMSEFRQRVEGQLLGFRWEGRVFSLAVETDYGFAAVASNVDLRDLDALRRSYCASLHAMEETLDLLLKNTALFAAQD